MEFGGLGVLGVLGGLGSGGLGSLNGVYGVQCSGPFNQAPPLQNFSSG